MCVSWFSVGVSKCGQGSTARSMIVKVRTWHAEVWGDDVTWHDVSRQIKGLYIYNTFLGFSIDVTSVTRFD